MDTPRETALCLLYDLLWPTGLDRGESSPEDLARERGRVDGTVAALASVGLISPEEAQEWRTVFSAGGQVPFVDASYREEAARVLGGFRDAAREAGEHDRGARLRYDGALSGLAEVGVVERAAWDDAFSAEFVVARFAGEEDEEGEDEGLATEPFPLLGTDQELVGVIAGPAELLESWRVLYGLRFLDDVVFGCWSEEVASRRDEEDEDESSEDAWGFDLDDDLGTHYGGGDSWGRGGFQGVSFPMERVEGTPTSMVLTSRSGHRLRVPL